MTINHKTQPYVTSHVLYALAVLILPLCCAIHAEKNDTLVGKYALGTRRHSGHRTPQNQSGFWTQANFGKGSFHMRRMETPTQ